MQKDTSLWASLGSLAGVLGGLAVLWGALLNWLRRPADHRLITAQADVAEATKEKTEAEGHSLAFGLISKALLDAERTIDRRTADRDAERQRADAAEARIAEMLEEQKTRHKMVNELTAYRMRFELLEAGVPLEEVMRKNIEPVYPEAEVEG